MAGAPPPAYLDDREIDWASIHTATFELRQSLRYEYPGPVEDLHQMLVLVPPDRMSGQVVLSHDLTVSPPARPRYGVYVSGHLLGEGAMHAWVQVLLPPAVGQGGPLLWQPFDPTHNRPVGLPYIDVAVGRDYEDVSPTRGSFRAPYTGQLVHSNKRAGVLAIA